MSAANHILDRVRVVFGREMAPQQVRQLIDEVKAGLASADPKPLLVARVYLEHDPFVPVMMVAFPADEGRAFVSMVGGELIDAMHDTSGQRYGYETDEAIAPADIRVAPLVAQARAIAERHRS